MNKPVPSSLAAPWAIEANWLRVVFGVWSRGQLEAAKLAEAKADWEARKSSRPRLDEPSAPVEGTGGTLRVVGSVGVITIDGPLFRHATLFSDISGGTSYDAIWRGLESALANRSVETILLRINSPGGEADGVSELAKGIRAASEQKPVWAYVDGMCASAAYWLASQAQHIVAEETGEIGSIGVRVGIVDDSAAAEAAGIREIEIISSQSPGKRSSPVDDELIGRIQTRIDDLADIFVGAVAEGRGVSVDKVLSDFGQGDVMIASKALEAGLVDEVGNFNGTLAALSSAGSTSSSPARAARAARGATMAIEKKPAAGGDAPPQEWKCEGCNEMMGASAKAYCAKCAEPDGDEDEDEAKALGVDAKATAAERRARMVALVGFEQRVFEATGAKSADAAVGRIAAGAKALGDVEAMQAQIAKAAQAETQRELRQTLERGLAGTPGKPAKLSLGAIQKSLAVVLRGDAKKGWLAAVEKLEADADAKKATVSASDVLDAVCAVPVTAEDLEAVREFVSASAPVAAPVANEPARDGKVEAAELDETAQMVAKAAARANAAMNRKRGPK